MPLSVVGTHFNVNTKPNSTCNVKSLTNSPCVTGSTARPFRNAPTTDLLSTSTKICARRQVSGYRVQNWSRTWYNANISLLLMCRASHSSGKTPPARTGTAATLTMPPHAVEDASVAPQARAAVKCRVFCHGL